MKFIKQFEITVLTTSLLFATLSIGHAATTEDSVRQIDHVQWNKSGTSTYQPIDTTTLLANEANLIFIRPLDNDNLQTSANIAIDGRFQTSLQPGHYSQIRYCSGQHNISVAPTGLKTNDLTNAYSHLVDFTAQQNHYIYVDIDDATGTPKLSKLDEATAQQILSNQTEQTHQISRVVRDCPAVVEVTPEPKPTPIVENVKADKPINLEVLFEFDKAVVQPAFNARIEAVADYMKKHPNTSTIIEGHTDNMGKDSYNMDLSQRRAEAVKQQLVTLYGIEPNRLQTQGFGETRPVDTNATPEGRYNNRRVVATVSADK